MGDITYDGDPLKDFGLAPFLDKFAYRNPKSSQKLADRYKRGESVAERRSGNEGRIQALISLPVNDPEFLEQEKVNEQDEFFHKFFVERARRDKIKGIVRNKPNQTEDDEEDALDDAMDAAEGSTGIDVGKTFEDYERAWEVDEEEEAFVDKLALSLMEDAEDAEIHGLDDEDPDMEGWDDMYDNEEDGESGEEPDIPDDDDESTDNGDFAGDNDDEDAFMDDEGDDSDSVGNLDAGNDIEGDFDEDDEGDLVFMDSDQSDGDDVSETETKPSKKRKKDMPAFADASDYEEMIEKSFNELQSNINSSDNGNESTEPAEKSSQKKKHKKKKAGKKRET
jgi:ribosome biogenesis protein MAK21